MELLCRSEMFYRMELFFGTMVLKGTQEL
jgi:hypothetical protein